MKDITPHDQVMIVEDKLYALINEAKRAAEVLTKDSSGARPLAIGITQMETGLLWLKQATKYLAAEELDSQQVDTKEGEEDANA